MPKNIQREGFLFLIVGAFNVGVTLAIFSALSLAFESKVNIQAIYWISALFGIINGFIWQKIFVWRASGNWKVQFTKFLILNLSISAINSFLLGLFVQVWDYPSIPTQIWITLILVIGSFLTNKFWVFTHRSLDNNAIKHQQ